MVRGFLQYWLDQTWAADSISVVRENGDHRILLVTDETKNMTTLVIDNMSTRTCVVGNDFNQLQSSMIFNYRDTAKKVAEKLGIEVKQYA